jgi:hypothetical protein
MISDHHRRSAGRATLLVRAADGILGTHNLDRGYDSTVTRQLLDELGFDGEIARKGIPAPIQAGTRWVVERTHSWMNSYGKLRRCTERNARIVDFYLYLAAALVTIRQLIQRARKRYRWDGRPTTKRLKLRQLPGTLTDRTAVRRAARTPGLWHASLPHGGDLSRAWPQERFNPAREAADLRGSRRCAAGRR